MSPEIINQDKHTSKVDIWCLGVLLYEMLHGYSPFQANSIKDISEALKNQEIVIEKNISTQCYVLLRKMLEKNQNMRFDINQVKDFMIEEIQADVHHKLNAKEIRTLVKNYLKNNSVGQPGIIPQEVQNFLREQTPYLPKKPTKQVMINFEEFNLNKKVFISNQNIDCEVDELKLAKKNDLIESKTKDPRCSIESGSDEQPSSFKTKPKVFALANFNKKSSLKEMFLTSRNKEKKASNFQSMRTQTNLKNKFFSTQNNNPQYVPQYKWKTQYQKKPTLMNLKP